MPQAPPEEPELDEEPEDAGVLGAGAGDETGVTEGAGATGATAASLGVTFVWGVRVGLGVEVGAGA